ncbi:MAG: hypothetical protein JSS02_26370 [Planctomycetes bacterium]|nr:hypothetical protein [Planctomycetota bacterium]
MNTFNLPEDAAAFLRAGRQFEYDASRAEAGDVKLKRFKELSLEEVWIGTDMDGDPHFGEDGYYAVPAVSLTGECKAYAPDFILLWLPQEKLFGTWDCDHWVLKVFRGARWSDIVANPVAYLNAQWDFTDTLGSQFVPWPQYEFKTGRPF